jgi:hypothetical protein
VIEMTVTADNGLDGPRVGIEPAHVLNHAVGTGTGVEQDPVSIVSLAHGDERGEPVLGYQHVGSLVCVHHRTGPAWQAIA